MSTNDTHRLEQVGAFVYPPQYDGSVKTLTLQAGKDLVNNLAKRKQPAKALVELVWNAIDAEADRIEIRIFRSDSGAIEQIEVTDDGHGFNRNEVEADFGKIGGSWKSTAVRTVNGKRALHGRKGRGRIRGFALGADVSWESVSEAVDQSDGSRFEKTRVSSTIETPEKIETSHESISEAETSTGTVFVAKNTGQWPLAAIDNGTAKAELLSNFAPILLKEPNLNIVFDGEALDIRANIETDFEDDFSYGENSEKFGHLRVIQWKTGSASSILFGPDNDHFIAELPANDLQTGFKYTAYVISPDITAENSADLTIGNMADGELGELWVAFERELKKYAAKVSRSQRTAKIEKWKLSGAYPYRTEPKNNAEQAERATFDLVAATISDHIPKDTQNAKLTLQLLKTALQNEPDDLGRILAEVVNLSEYDRATLSSLLQETTLPAIISSANKVAQRSKFLVALESMLFNPEISTGVKERDHLHKILENELWIFGEEYSVMRSEKSLTDLLRVHFDLEGLDDKIGEPVRRWDGKTGRTDLHLAVKGKEFRKSRHLIVELKAPAIKAKRTELDQIEDYANSIATNSAFATQSATWDIVLLVTDIDEVVSNRFLDPNTGLIQDINHPGKPRVRSFVRRWADVIEENRHRLTFYSEALEHDPTAHEGMNYVRTHYADYLPTELTTEDGDAA